jgi:segregation and condensation protein B
VEQVRGVNSDGPIASLIARGLVEEVGRAPGPGRPALLATTMRFLEHFGLKNPADLPPLPSNSSLQLVEAVDE